MRAISGKIYTYSEITKLDLLDSPHLSVPLQFKASESDEGYLVCCPIQDAHVNESDLLSVPGFAESKWRYVRTTHEWIPLFTFVGNNALELVDVELDLESTRSRDDVALWITPKGFPRAQYGHTELEIEGFDSVLQYEALKVSEDMHKLCEEVRACFKA